MKEDLYASFIDKLEKKYGTWEKGTSKFGDSSFGKIAKDLCISKSQFSLLISNKGTEGMYIRSIRNVEQLIKYDKQSQLLSNLSKKSKPRYLFRIAAFILVSFMLSAILIGYLISNFWNNKQYDITQHPLAYYFDSEVKSNYVSPYLPELDVQKYCPCSGFEGEWELENEYIIPLPSKKPGLYYVAKSSDIRLKCQKSADSSDIGKSLIGFENMHNELWVDKTRTSFSPKYFNIDSKNYTKEFIELELDKNPNFVKVCDIYTCFLDRFLILDDKITRKGEPCGRYAKNINVEIAEEYKIDIDHILKNVISSMAKVECQPAINKYCNPNLLQENISTLEYDCMFKIRTENLGIGGGYPYTKRYRLIKQNYSDNLLCNCEQSRHIPQVN